jgi:hypothetical protein
MTRDPSENGDQRIPNFGRVTRHDRHDFLANNLDCFYVIAYCDAEQSRGFCPVFYTKFSAMGLEPVAIYNALSKVPPPLMAY